MLGAAPGGRRHRHARHLAFSLVAGGVWFAAAANAGTAGVSTGAANDPILAVQFDARTGAAATPALLSKLRKAGVRAVVYGGNGSASAEKRLAMLARRAQLSLILPVRPPRRMSELTRLRRSCTARRAVVNRCAIATPSGAEVNAWLRRDRVDWVILSLRSPAVAARLQPKPTKRARLLAVVRLAHGANLDADWKAAVAASHGTGGFSLGVAPDSLAPKGVLDRYLALVESTRKTVSVVPDTEPPEQPSGLVVTARGLDFVTVAWTGIGEATGYALFVNSVPSGSTTSSPVTVPTLACGTTYTIGLEAIDAAGNRSSRAAISAQTVPCPSGSGVDTKPPTTPAGITVTIATATSVVLSWPSSTDDVAIAGYGIYRGSVLVATTLSPTYLVAGLSCGTSTTVGVDAYDAAGNRSETANIIVSTTPCVPSDSQAPSIPASFVATATTPTSIAVSWNGSTDNVGVGGYGLYRNGSLVATRTQRAYTYSGLACGTSYTVAVDAYDAAGNRSAQASFSTTTAACPDTSPPSTPTTLVASGQTQTSINLAWNAATDNTGVAGYGVYRNGTLLTSQVTRTYTYTGLACGTTYTLGIDAYDTAGNRSATTTTSATTSACPDTTAPTSPAGFVASGQTQTSINLAWNAATDNTGVAGYGVYRNGTLLTSQVTRTYTYTGLACGTTYTLGIDAYDTAGNRSSTTSTVASTTACAVPDTQAPSPPTGAAATTATPNSIAIGWTAATDNVGVAGYGVYLDGALVGSEATLAYIYSGLSCGTSYTVAVDAYDAAGNRSAQASFSTTTAACPDTSPPSTPTTLVASGQTQTSINLAWNAATDNTGVAGYGVYRNGTLLTSQVTRTYTYTGLACGTTYTLGIDAYDTAGNRSATTTTSATTSACPDTTAPNIPSALAQTAASETSVTVGWTASTDNVAVTGYAVFLGSSQLGTTTARTFTVTGLSCGTSQTIGVEAFDAAGNRSTRSTLSASTSSCAPPSSGSANVWVDGNGGSCVRAATAGAYADGQACGSLNAAYQAAVAGDRILVKGGSYPAQNINDRSSLPVGSADVIIQPAPGETAVFFDVTIWAHDLVFEGGGTIGSEEPNRFVFQDSMDVQMASANSGDRHVTVEDVKAESTFVQADKVDIRYSDFGPLNICTDENGTDDLVKLWWWNVNGSDRGSRNITFEYNLVHENLDNGCAGGNPHNDAIQMELDDSVIRGNRIWHCGTQCIFQGYNSRNVIIENNMIEETDACPRCGISTEVGVAGNITLRNNTIAGNVTFSGGTIPAAALVTGNLFLTGIGCDPAGTYRNNIYPANSGSACGSGARRGTPILSNGQPYSGDRNADWHLHPSDTIARNNGDTTNNPNTDIDGQPRPQGTIDAGADEIG